MTARVVIQLIVLLGIFATANAMAPPPLTGSIFEMQAGTNTAHASAGLSVYVLSENADPKRQWIGPVLTDQYGRFAFSDLPDGRYLMRVFDSKGTRVWQQMVNVPATLKPIVISPQGK